MLSFAFRPLTKALEYHVTGTVNHPASKPVYIPSMLLWPLHLFRTLKNLVGQANLRKRHLSAFDQPPQWLEE